MHEVALVRELVNAALEAARHNDAGRIVRISVVLGEHSHLTDEALRFNFDVLGRGTAAEGAEVIVRREPGTVICSDCGISAGQGKACAGCGSEQMISGDECYLENITVEGAGRR
jgi:hydrogenase nickel incorporation protein HypA/HybF